MQLRYLQTLTEIASEQNSTIIFPLPIELVHLLQARAGSADKGGMTTDARDARALAEEGFQRDPADGQAAGVPFMATTVVSW